MTFLFRRAVWLFPILVACISGGCGGGGGLSAPDPQTSAGLGTLIVSVSGASTGREGVVFLDELARPTKEGRAYFYNITPGRYRVTASLYNNGTFNGSGGEKVDIVADKTRRISVNVPFYFGTPTPTRSRTGLTP